MALNKLVAGTSATDLLASTGADVAAVVNGLVQEDSQISWSTLGCVKIGGGGNFGTDVSDRTLAATFVLARKPARVRLHLLNANPSAPVTGIEATMSRTANVSSGFNPSVGNSGFRNFVFTTNTIPAAVTGSSAHVVPSEIVSQWLNPYAIDRDDGGSGWILMLRVYQDAANAGAKMNFTGTGSLFDFEKFKGRVGLSATTGNFKNTTTTFNDNGLACPFFWLEVDYESPVKTLAIIGDSIMQGTASAPSPSASAACYGAPFIAIQEMNGETANNNWQLFNGGWGGASTAGTGGQISDGTLNGYLGQFQSYVQNGALPTIAAFCPWSVNNLNPYSVSGNQYMRQSLGVFMSICKRNGIIPALVTPAPRNGLTEAEEGARRAVVQYIKDFCSANGVLLIDRDSVYTNYDVGTGGYKNPAWTSDGIHPTEAGFIQESVEWKSKLRAAFAAY